MNEVYLILECKVDLKGLAEHLHITPEETRSILHKNSIAFARQMSKNPQFFHVYGEIDLDDLGEPLALGKFVKEQFEVLNKKLDRGVV